MNRPARLIVSHVLWALLGFLYLGIAPDVHATTVTDTFQFRGTVKEWCQGNPRFFETSHANVKDGITLTVTRDPLNTGDLTNIQATLNNTVPADVNAMTMNGLAFPSNKSGSTAQIVLLGTLNNGHFLSVRGQGGFDKLGNLTKATGTFSFQITDTYTIDKLGNQSGPVDCFGSGTFVTGKKLVP